MAMHRWLRVSAFSCWAYVMRTASAVIVMVHRWLRVSAFSCWAYVMRTASAVIVMVRERHGFVFEAVLCGVLVICAVK